MTADESKYEFGDWVIFKTEENQMHKFLGQIFNVFGGEEITYGINRQAGTETKFIKDVPQRFVLRLATMHDYDYGDELISSNPIE
jgi:hypothetical protein